MKKKITFLLMFVLSLSMVSAQGTFRFGTSATPEGKTLLVDSKGLILDGKHSRHGRDSLFPRTGVGMAP